MSDSFLIITEHGKVVARVNPAAEHGLADDVLVLEPATPENSQDISMETPLRAFAAKMLDIIESKGSTGLTMPETVLTMMKKEKASQTLSKIERFARQQQN